MLTLVAQFRRCLSIENARRLPQHFERKPIAHSVVKGDVLHVLAAAGVRRVSLGVMQTASVWRARSHDALMEAQMYKLFGCPYVLESGNCAVIQTTDGGYVFGRFSYPRHAFEQLAAFTDMAAAKRAFGTYNPEKATAKDRRAARAGAFAVWRDVAKTNVAR